MKKINDIAEDNFNRLAASIMEHRKCSYEEALAILNTLKVHFIIGPELEHSIPLQAALLTAINTGVRCFLGGVTIQMSNKEIKSLLPWPGNILLSQIMMDLGATFEDTPEQEIPTLEFGQTGTGSKEHFKIVCNNWQGGVVRANEVSPFLSEGNSPLAGIATGSLGVSVLFFHSSSIHPAILDNENGISLWRPDLHWLDLTARGPNVETIPKKYWILGLGHLGQAYIWTIGLFNFKNPKEVKIFLQDTDKMTEANISAGLLCQKSLIGKYKTRICSAWLEERGISTSITERRYDEKTIRRDQEPYLALCGFDNARSRTFLEDSGFKTIVESGLGGKLSSFDKITLHTFPSSNKKPSELWHLTQDKSEILHEAVQQDFINTNGNPCGVLAETLASTSISTSFVGAFAAALTIAEVVRGANGGQRIDTIALQLRSLKYKKIFLHTDSSLLLNLAPNGFADLL